MAQVYKIDKKRYEFKEIDSVVQTSYLVSEGDHNKWIKAKTEDNSIEIQLPEGLSNGFRCVIENTGVFTVNYVNAAGTSIATQQDKFTEDQFRTIEAVYNNGIWRLQGYIGRQDLSSLYDVNVTANGLPSNGDALVFDVNSNVWRAGKNVPFIPADPFFLDHIITNEDHGKVLLFDTTAAPITVTFNLGLEDGLHVKLINIGNGTLTIASAGTLNAAGTTLAEYQSMDIIHAASNIFYGVISDGIGGTGGTTTGGGYAAGNYFDTYISTSYTGLFPTTHSTTSNSLAIGTLSRSFQDNQILIGSNTTADGTYDIAIGDQADCDGSSIQKISLGRQAKTNANNAIAIGFSAEVSGSYGVALGADAHAFSPSSIQLGAGTNNESQTLNYLSAKIAHSFGLNLKREDAENTTINTHRFAANTSNGGVAQHPTLASIVMSFPNKVLYVGTGTVDNIGSPHKQWVPINVSPNLDFIRTTIVDNISIETAGASYYPAGHTTPLWIVSPTGADDNINKEQWVSLTWEAPQDKFHQNEPFFRTDNSDTASLTPNWRDRRWARWVVQSNVSSLDSASNGPFSVPAADFTSFSSLLQNGDRVLFTGQTDTSENGIYRLDTFDGNFYVFNRPEDLQLGASFGTEKITIWGSNTGEGKWTPDLSAVVGDPLTLSFTDPQSISINESALYFSIKAPGNYHVDLRLLLLALSPVTNIDARATLTLRTIQSNNDVKEEEYKFNLGIKDANGANSLKDIKVNEIMTLTRGLYYFTLTFYDTPDILLYSQNNTNANYPKSKLKITPVQLFEAPY